MAPYISAPFTINIVAIVAFFALSSFIASRVLAATPDIAIPTHSLEVQAAHAVLQNDYAGIIAWVSANEIKITDNFGVSHAFAINDKTHILIHGYPVGSATYANLRVLDHVRVTSLEDGASVQAQTIVVQ